MDEGELPKNGRENKLVQERIQALRDYVEYALNLLELLLAFILVREVVDQNCFEHDVYEIKLVEENAHHEQKV